MSLQNSHQISEVKVMLAKGIDGNGIASIEKTGTQGLVDVYTITYTNGEKTTFTVTNGAGGGMSALLLITSDAGSVVTVTTPSGRTITAEQVSGSSTQWQAETTEYGVHTIDAVLSGSDAQVTVSVDTCKIYLIDDSHFSATITAKYPDGMTCRCQGGSESYYATGSPYTFSVHSANTFTITVTDGADTYTDTVVITTDGQSESLTVPAPADAPANDLDWWLWYGDIDNTGGTYSTLADVLADANALSDLMASTEAVDYLVRCTSWVSDITANQSAMSYIGLNNYCANTLLADSTWLNAICNSTYFESVLNVKVPAMTSATTPSGVVNASSQTSQRPAWKAFDGFLELGDHTWSPNEKSSDHSEWIEYEFENPFIINRFAYILGSNRNCTVEIQGSDDGVTYADIKVYSNVRLADRVATYETIENIIAYRRIRVHFDNMPFYGSSVYYMNASFQFYGRQNV